MLQPCLGTMLYYTEKLLSMTQWSSCCSGLLNWARLEPVVWFMLLVFVVVFAKHKTSVLKVDASIFKATYFHFVMAYEMSLEQTE